MSNLGSEFKSQNSENNSESQNTQITKDINTDNLVEVENSQTNKQNDTQIINDIATLPPLSKFQELASEIDLNQSIDNNIQIELINRTKEFSWLGVFLMPFFMIGILLLVPIAMVFLLEGEYIVSLVFLCDFGVYLVCHST